MGAEFGDGQACLCVHSCHGIMEHFAALAFDWPCWVHFRMPLAPEAMPYAVRAPSGAVQKKKLCNESVYTCSELIKREVARA